MSSEAIESLARRRFADPMLARACGLPLAHFRPEHVAEQVKRACAREEVRGTIELASLLASDDRARTRFRRSVAISHAGMFRDPDQFELLERVILPRLLEDGRRLTVWSAGCSDGSEPYTLGVVLERMGVLERSLLLGSDLLDENLVLARAGSYDGHTISTAVRARMRWERRDVVADGPPAGHWRLVLCRNVAIYMAPSARRALHENLVQALGPSGVLMLGRSERLIDPHALGLRAIAPHAYERVR
jgi:chemotaxis protein methyltransferase CheR